MAMSNCTTAITNVEIIHPSFCADLGKISCIFQEKCVAIMVKIITLDFYATFTAKGMVQMASDVSDFVGDGTLTSIECFHTIGRQ